MNQFTQSVLDAKNKMNMLTNPTDDVIMLVTNLYNSTCPPRNATPNANPFGMGSMNATAPGIFGEGGGGGTTTQSNTNLFGTTSTVNTPNPFARNTPGFGMAAQSQPTNLFGGSQAPAPSMNPFGAAPSAAGNTSLFGGSSFQNSNTNSSFGASTQPTSLFGGSTASGPFSQQSTAASPFALPAPATQSQNPFGGQAQSNPVFGGGATFGNQMKTTGLFGQANAAIGQTPSAPATIFGQSIQNSGFGAAPQTQTNLFGAAAPAPNQSIFGGGAGAQQSMNAQTPDNPFAAVAQTANTNIFGNAPTQMQSAQQPPQPSPFQTQGNVFGGGGATTTTNTFGNATGFGAFQSQQNNQMGAMQQPQQPPQQQQTLQQQQQSIFGTNSFAVQPTAAATAPVQNAFGGNSFQTPQDANKPAQPLFGASMQPKSNPFGAQTAAQQLLPQPSKNLYTPMESLSSDEIEAFKCDSFDIAKLPTKPPPMEMCM